MTIFSDVVNIRLFSTSVNSIWPLVMISTMVPVIIMNIIKCRIRLPLQLTIGVPSSTLSVNTPTETKTPSPRYSDTRGVILIEMSVMEEQMKSLEKLDDKVVTELCEDYAAYTRVNISEEHGQVVTQMAAIEEQISTFSEMLTDIQANKYGSDTHKT